ncbi:MAG: DNA topoisomerase VI subunit B [Candidatus Aenigmatarchaeota archaeon]
MAESVHETAQRLSNEQREISVSEFFEKNRHLLGYDNKVKALLTVVREAVDNSLDACEDARIVPDIRVSVKPIDEKKERFKVMVEDNGPGIVKEKLNSAFGSLLHGSKFHRLRQSRGQQGIGISGAILYSQLTSGKPIKITSSTGNGKAHTNEIMIDVAKNKPMILKEESKDEKDWHGIKIQMEVEGKYVEHQQSILEYLKQTAIANPYARITFDSPNGKVKFDRATKTLPPLAKSIKPHPHGIEIGILDRMLRGTQSRNLSGFLINEFSRVGSTSANEICKIAKMDKGRKPSELTPQEIEKLFNAIQSVQLIKPPLDCLSPLGEKLIEEGLKNQLNCEFVVALTRPPDVYRGNPFQIEVGIAYGGQLDPAKTATLYRLANRVPLLYQAGDCAISKAIEEVEWKRYGLNQSGSSLPSGPLAIFVHMCSVWVPFTSESKEAIASYPEIIKEVKLALQEVSRRLSVYIHKKRKVQESQLRSSLFEKYVPEVAESLFRLTGKDKHKLILAMEKILKRGQIQFDEMTADQERVIKAGAKSEEGLKKFVKSDEE